MARIAVESKTGMCGVEYFAEKRILEIEFKSRKEGQPNTVYHYFDVGQGDYDVFMAQESKGSHFIRHIKPAFKCVKQPPAEEVKAANG